MQMVVQTTVDDGTPTTDTLYFSYDASGIPMSLIYNGADYYYTVNLQGDVTAILNTSGTAVVEYTYDAWGNILTVTGSMADTLGAINPLTYRGYVYDTETGLYYLQSRYYNPETGRFLNVDGYMATGQGLLGNNMFTYCENNPVNRADPSGNSWESIQKYIKLLFYTVIRTIRRIKSAENNNTTMIPDGGETVFRGQVRICTDGSDGSLVPDDCWYPYTALDRGGEPLDAYTVYYVVVPINESKRDKLLGCCALLINHDTGMCVWRVVGDEGLSENGWGEVSIATIWDTGNPNHMTANSAYGLGSNYEIILYRDRKYDFGD